MPPPYPQKSSPTSPPPGFPSVVLQLLEPRTLEPGQRAQAAPLFPPCYCLLLAAAAAAHVGAGACGQSLGLLPREGGGCAMPLHVASPQALALRVRVHVDYMWQQAGRVSCLSH